jgi:hypothetical protein
MENWHIRKIEKKDNAAVARLIRAVFDELNIPKIGTAYEDPYLDLMFEEYNKLMEKLRVLQELLHWKMKRPIFVNCKKCIFYQKRVGKE